VGKYDFRKVFIILGLLASQLVFATNKTDNSNQGTLVEVAQVQVKPFHKQITVPGTLRAHQGIVVRSELDGRITNIYFKSGDIVQAGAPLVQLYKDVIAARLQQSQAELQLAKQDYTRMTELHKTHAVSTADFDKAAAQLNVDTGKVAEYQAQLKQTLISAPFSGRLGLSAVNLGDYVKTGQNIASLQMIDPIEVEFEIPEIYLSNIAVGQDVSVTSRSYAEHAFSGKIYAIDAEVNMSNRSINTRATIPNVNSKLLPGGFVEVNIDITKKEPIVIIPQTAVLYDIGQTYVYRVINHKAVKTLVKLGDRDRANVTVLQGLQANDVVVAAGQLNIEDGAMVRF